MFGVLGYSQGSQHIDTSVNVKSMKLAQLSYRVTRNIFLNRDTRYGHMGNDISIFLGEFFFVQNVSTYTSLEPEFNAD